MGFADNVRANRERLGLSQEELARRVGLTNSAVSQWEGGRAKPRIGVMKALSEIFGRQSIRYESEASAHALTCGYTL